MVSDCSLKEIFTPEDRHLDEEYWHLPRSNIYMSDDFLPDYIGQGNEKALILIQGTGAVRAG